MNKFITDEFIMVYLCGATTVGRPPRGASLPNNRHRMTITLVKRNKAKQALLTGQEKT
ncbi:MAG: hypothetical protein ACI9LE_000331 [Paraglaciecola sp.]|jgi:hypothetical protein